MYHAYRFCKVFGTTIVEYESRSYTETQWLMAIDNVFEAVKKEKQPSG